MQKSLAKEKRRARRAARLAAGHVMEDDNEDEEDGLGESGDDDLGGFSTDFVDLA